MDSALRPSTHDLWVLLLCAWDRRRVAVVLGRWLHLVTRPWFAFRLRQLQRLLRAHDLERGGLLRLWSRGLSYDSGTLFGSLAHSRPWLAESPWSAERLLRRVRVRAEANFHVSLHSMFPDLASQRILDFLGPLPAVPSDPLWDAAPP